MPADAMARNPALSKQMEPRPMQVETHICYSGQFRHAPSAQAARAPSRSFGADAPGRHVFLIDILDVFLVLRHPSLLQLSARRIVGKAVLGLTIARAPFAEVDLLGAPPVAAPHGLLALLQAGIAAARPAAGRVQAVFFRVGR